METYVVRAPGGLDRLEIVGRDNPGESGPGEVRVAIHATSLNFHDLLVANGGIPTEDGRVLMADGAGVVEAVGAGVAEFAPGDRVVSTFFPHWIAGRPFTAVGNFAGTPGDGIDGALQAGQTVLTLGSGGVSLAALQLAKSMGAHVAATFSSDEKCERLPRSGGGALDAD